MKSIPSLSPSFAALSRRDFLGGTIAAATAGVLAPVSGASAKPGVCIGFFSKMLQWMDWGKMADLLAAIGYQGIECPVRKRGQILPERVEDDLPRLIDVLAKRNLKILQATTDVIDARDPLSVRVLRALARNGVKLYRLGTRKYVDEHPIPAQLDAARLELRELAALNGELGIEGGIQNHSGAGYVGAPVWDIWTLLHDVTPPTLGISFDIGHAVLEGGYTWPINFRLIRPLLKAVYVKEFHWEKTERGEWKAKWGPLGEGMMPARFLPMLRQTGYSGFICHHLEYLTATVEDKAAQKTLIDQMHIEFRTLKGWLDAAGFGS